MKPTTIMLIAGETSGDLLAADLVDALRAEWGRRAPVGSTDLQPLEANLEPRFCGAGGPRMAAAGVELAFDFTQHAVVGLSDVLRHYLKFRRLFRQLLDLAFARLPDLIVCVDFSGFNRRWVRALRRRLRAERRTFNNWRPQIVQYVSPQVWASRPGRAAQLATDFDRLLCLFPFERDWYAQHTPGFAVDFVGHPLLDRYPRCPLTPSLSPTGGEGARRASEGEPGFMGRGQPQKELEPFHEPTKDYNRHFVAPATKFGNRQLMDPARDFEIVGPSPALPLVLLLPGSRDSEIRRHLPVMIETAKRMASERRLAFRVILPNVAQESLAREVAGEVGAEVAFQVGGLTESLAEAQVALACTGTVTLECALAGLPTVTLYKTSAFTYQVGRRLVTVPYLTMPNLLAGEELFPEFIQGAATAPSLAQATTALLADSARRAVVKSKLARIAGSLGGTGASRRAARVIADLLLR